VIADLLQLAGLTDTRNILEVLVAEHGVVVEIERRALNHTYNEREFYMSSVSIPYTHEEEQED
jgi:hypothetical protein